MVETAIEGMPFVRLFVVHRDCGWRDPTPSRHYTIEHLRCSPAVSTTYAAYGRSGKPERPWTLGSDELRVTRRPLPAGKAERAKIVNDLTSLALIIPEQEGQAWLDVADVAADPPLIEPPGVLSP